MKKEIPEVKEATAISWSRTNTFAVGDKTIKEDGYSAGANFFTLLSYPVLEGHAKNVLNSPNTVAFFRKMAADLFGSPYPG